MDEVITTSGLARTNFGRLTMGVPALAKGEKIILLNASMAQAEEINPAVSFVRENVKKVPHRFT